MKKLIFASVFALGMITAVNAQEEKQPTAMNVAPVKEMNVKSPATTSQDFKEISVSDLPQVVKNSVIKTYEDKTIANAYSNENGVFKLVLTDEEDADSADKVAQTVYLNQKGEFIEKQ